jgi:chromosome segregation protein
MILKKLEIQGFKSFAKKTTIEFCDDITSIIGPNGSGKSNIVDAIRWVMGEQRIKPLRAGKMEDIIFSGTTEKKALGYAQVSMTLDNTSGIFKNGYDEICVTRRLFRQGQSEYYINKTACRLKDVQELFMDTGLGREGYSVIGQGQIESIVNNSPYERRLLIEEAAGIVKFKMRKQEAERNLERAQNNLYRITDILSELESRLPALKRQSEKAEKYVAYKNELKELEVGIFVHRMDILKNDLEKNRFGKSSLEESISNIDENIAMFDEKYRLLKTDTARCEEQIASVNNSLHELVSTYENSKAEIQLARIKIENFTEAIAKAKADIEQYDELIGRLLDERADAQAALVGDENELAVLEPAFRTKQNAADLLGEKYVNIDSFISKITGDINAQDALLTKNKMSSMK